MSNFNFKVKKNKLFKFNANNIFFCWVIYSSSESNFKTKFLCTLRSRTSPQINLFLLQLNIASKKMYMVIVNG